MKKQKNKILVYVIVLLWIGALTQVLVNSFFMKEDRIMEAFANTYTNIMESRLELTADCGDQSLTLEKKREMIREVADAIGLSEYQLVEKTGDNASITLGQQSGKNAKVSIKIVTLSKEVSQNTQQYIMVYLDLFDKPESILQYKEILESTMRTFQVKEQQTILRFRRDCEGELTEEEKEKEVEEILEYLEARTVEKYSEKAVLNVYAYTGLLKEYLTVNNNRVNINVAVTYDEIEDRTIIYLATPILNEDY